MNSGNGGQSSSDLQRQTAAAIARKKVLAAYVDAAKKSAGDNAHLKDEPTTSRINSESWKRYHSAWQNYYQKYYSDYYSRAAKEYIEKERQKLINEDTSKNSHQNSVTKTNTATEQNSSSISITDKNSQASAYDSSDSEGRIQHYLRSVIRKKANENASKSRRKKRFLPILAGISVVIIILFLQYNRLIFAPIMAYVSPGNTPSSEIEALDPTISQTVSPEPRLIIPKLNIDVPIHFGVSLADVMSSMNNGVAHYRIAGASAFPGEIGNLVITGHSAGDIYSSNPYKYIFSGLERLEDGDLIYVNYNSTRYIYRVVKKEVVDPSNVAALVVDTNKPIITLVTCTPLGTSRYRLLVTGEQISPVYGQESESSQDSSETVLEETQSLPSNEPSFFENVWNFLTGN